MNQRIKLLAEQADLYARSHNSSMLFENYQKRYTEKFAELIVKECAELSVNSQYTNTKSEYYEGFNEALIYTGNKIRKHFGVEK